MKFTTTALLALLTPAPSTLRVYLFAAASPPVDEHGSPGVTASGLRSSANRSTRKTSSVDPDYWIVPVKDGGLTCIDNSIRAGGDKDDDYKCITEGEAICITYDDQYFGGKWMFGVKDSMAKLWNPKMEVVWEFCTELTHVCIGEEHGYDPNRYSEERPYLNFYNEKTHEVVGSLTCDGTDGKDGKNLGQASILKMVDQADLGQYVAYPIDIVKFKKGQTPDPEDDNALWNITFDPTDPRRLWWDSMRDFDATYSYNQDKCVWTDQCPSNAPSSVPSASPSDVPSSAPSTLAYPYELAPSEECSPFEDIRSIGGTVNLTASGFGFDDYLQIDLPKVFNFYEDPKDRVFLSSYGYLSFLPNTDYTDFTPDPIPSSNAPNNFIAPFWTDLDPGASGGEVHYLISPDPQNEFIVQFTNVPFFGNEELRYTFQAVLSFVDGAIEFRYGDMDAARITVTVGLENVNGRRGLPIDPVPIKDGNITCVGIKNTSPFVSKSPSAAPSLSPKPSISPEPSSGPSISPAPSVSFAPSTSVAPSSNPTQECPLPRQTTGSDSCQGNCGGDAGDCFCDTQCIALGDCCTDAASICPEVEEECENPNPEP